MSSARFQFYKLAVISAAAFTGDLLSGQQVGQPVDAPVDVQVRPTMPRQRNSTEYISTVQELRHRVPSKARQEMEKGDKARVNGKTSDAILHMGRAIAIDPEYIAARNNLAITYLTMGESQAAISQLEAAAKIDPNRAILFNNMAVALAMQRRYDDAERAARRAVGLDGASRTIRTLLGMILFGEKKYNVETLRCFDGASEDDPWIHLLTARILIAQGHTEAAKTEIQGYLATGETENRNLAQNWLEAIDRSVQVRAANVPE